MLLKYLKVDIDGMVANLKTTFAHNEFEDQRKLQDAFKEAVRSELGRIWAHYRVNKYLFEVKISASGVMDVKAQFWGLMGYPELFSKEAERVSMYGEVTEQTVSGEPSIYIPEEEEP